MIEQTVNERGTPERYAAEERAITRSHELIHELDGNLRAVLRKLHTELYREITVGDAPDRGKAMHEADHYAHELVDHVEQVWATAIVR